MAAVRAVLEACPGATVLPAPRRGNVVGALQLGLAARNGGADGLGILEAAASGRTELLVLLGVDPIADCPDADLARRALAGARRVIAVDTFLTDSSRRADVVLAAAAFGEKSGTTTNLEGRVTTVTQKVTPTGTARPDWMIAAQLAQRLGHDELASELSSLNAITDAIAEHVPAYSAASRGAVHESRDGVLAVPDTDDAVVESVAPAVAALDRNSYDYRLVVGRKLYDRAVGTAMSPSLAPLAPPSAAHVNPLDLAGLGVSEGTDVQVSGARGSVVLPLAADPAVPRGALFVPFNVPGVSIADIVDARAPVNDVRVERM
jgi:predicted molibdopterin-dependent oxidoreductase YjgC